jgi:hypothetical protein
MAFDIHALDRLDDWDEDTEAAREEYQDTLAELFLASPEGQELADLYPEPGFWSYQFVSYGFTYIGVSLPQMERRDAREIIEELFPRKISLFSPDDADKAIPELIAFWQYLEREYRLPNARAMLRYLREMEPEFKRMMLDPANFGIAKSFFMQGQALGLDMTTQEGAEAFMALYNAAALSALPGAPLDTFSDSLPGRPHASDQKTSTPRKRGLRPKRIAPPKAKKKKRRRR